ncbi:MAG: hypothetical protein O7C66_08365 [Alphaproteobacteria bacterium]|nr:hypothetical protein [Alphaproteobacteria bacterium]
MSSLMMAKVTKAKIRCEEKFVLVNLADGASDENGHGDGRDGPTFLHIPPVEEIAKWCGLPLSRAAAIIEAFKAHGIVAGEDWDWWFDLKRAENLYPPVPD